MRVVMVVGTVGPLGVGLEPGTEVDLPDGLAHSWLLSGRCKLPEDKPVTSPPVAQRDPAPSKRR